MTTEYTQNFRLALPDFRMGPWHDLLNNNTITIDELMMSVLQGVDTRPWTNNTIFEVGMTCIDVTDNTFWVCSVTHTSAAEPTTFAEDRVAHPTYWARVVVGIAPRGEWLNSTHYLPNDMVNDSNEGVIAVCNTEHTSSPVPATIRADEVYWSFIADMGAGGSAIGIYYDNTASGVPADNVQEALDLTFENDAQNALDITNLEAAVSALDVRVTHTEDVNDTQDTNINNNALAISGIDLRLTTVENAGYITDAPANGTTYGRKDHNWLAIPTTAGIPEAPIDTKYYARKDAGWAQIDTASVLVSDTPPAGAPNNALWWESDTGRLYIKYNDGDSSQWVSAIPEVTGASIGAAPFDALAFNGMQINGSMDCAQEFGTTGTSTNGKQPVDAWTLSRSGTNAVTVQQVASGIPGFANLLYIGVSTPETPLGAGNFVMLGHNIEGFRAQRLAWGTPNAMPITIGFWTAHVRAGIYSVTIRNNAANRSYATTYNQNVANIAEYHTVTIPGDQTGTWFADSTAGLVLNFCMGSGTTFIAPTNNTWLAGNYIAATGQVNALQSTGDAFRITGVVVLPGIEAPTAGRSALIMRPYNQELLLCKRYLNVISGLQASVPVAAGICYNTTLIVANYQFPVQMRSSPTFSTPNVANWYAHISLNTIPLNALSLGAVSPLAVRLDAGVASGLTAGQAGMVSAANTSAQMMFESRV